MVKRVNRVVTSCDEEGNSCSKAEKKQKWGAKKAVAAAPKNAKVVKRVNPVAK